MTVYMSVSIIGLPWWIGYYAEQKECLLYSLHGSPGLEDFL